MRHLLCAEEVPGYELGSDGKTDVRIEQTSFQFIHQLHIKQLNFVEEKPAFVFLCRGHLEQKVNISLTIQIPNACDII